MVILTGLPELPSGTKYDEGRTRGGEGDPSVTSNHRERDSNFGYLFTKN